MVDTVALITLGFHFLFLLHPMETECVLAAGKMVVCIFDLIQFVFVGCLTFEVATICQIAFYSWIRKGCGMACSEGSHLSRLSY